MNSTAVMLPNFDEVAKSEERRSFASLKFDILDAIAIDPRVRPFDFRVAYLLLQYMNSQTGLICPSQKTLAVFLKRSVDSIQRAVGNLVETGWLSVYRPNRQKSNRYKFEKTNVAAMLDRRTSLMDGIREERLASDTARMRPQIRSDAARLRCPDTAGLRPEHLERITYSSVGIERETLDSQYGTEDEVTTDAA